MKPVQTGLGDCKYHYMFNFGETQSATDYFFIYHDREGVGGGGGDSKLITFVWNTQAYVEPLQKV